MQPGFHLFLKWCSCHSSFLFAKLHALNKTTTISLILLYYFSPFISCSLVMSSKRVSFHLPTWFHLHFILKLQFITMCRCRILCYYYLTPYFALKRVKQTKKIKKKNPFRRVNKMRGINCIIELFKELQSSELWAWCILAWCYFLIYPHYCMKFHEGLLQREDQGNTFLYQSLHVKIKKFFNRLL